MDYSLLQIKLISRLKCRMLDEFRHTFNSYQYLQLPLEDIKSIIHKHCRNYDFSNV